MLINERKKIIIWGLYDDANSSYKKALKEFKSNFKIEVHSIGINDVVFNEKKDFYYHKIDLSLNNFNLIKDLEKLPKPDFIFASPPCESWSGADCGGKMFRKITKSSNNSDSNWSVQNREFYDDYNETAHPVKRRYFIQKERGRIIGESTIGGTISIIEHFKPKFWVIENPQTSKMWDYIENHWCYIKNYPKTYKNITYYSSYNSNFSLKPTIFKSNLKLKLKNKNNENNSNSRHMGYGSYAQRSSIPKELINDIMEQFCKRMDDK